MNELTLVIVILLLLSPFIISICHFIYNFIYSWITFKVGNIYEKEVVLSRDPFNHDRRTFSYEVIDAKEGYVKIKKINRVFKNGKESTILGDTTIDSMHLFAFYILLTEFKKKN